MRPQPLKRLIRGGVTTLFLVSGVTHLARPKVFYPLMPAWLPQRDLVICGSGVAEIVCGVGLLARRGWAPGASAALLLAVWPGNVEQAVRVTRTQGTGSAASIAAWARVPLQIPMIWSLLGSDAIAAGGQSGIDMGEGRSHNNGISGSPAAP